MRNSRRFLQHIAALARLGRHHIGDFALTDNGVTVPAEARIHKQLVYVAKTRGFAVHEIFAVARTVITPCNRHLVAVFIKRTVGVVKAQRYLRKALCLADVRTRKNNVLHF